ncbi:sulfatase-like hydrolase/transferase [Luteolibacter arcticus]|uniref:Sulfatase-like hydrolase/transferase n=1 Tax=Luteolibacter arcticus TaxID=1581411 RepID=A0ABT3GMB7_9BACT|nr:sulfatase-like hydrolase/transferase [Luteolibacter arcticus]MCW1924667.1 sulfatase-like hydrolase/transferase [Luteolibacter arcticus]
MKLTALLSFLPLALIAAEKPNIVLIYADDLGFGDVSCNGATAVQTPNIDRIAKEGINFTAGYATSATCTPSRFSLLTGKYAWRQEGTGILPGDAALIIDPAQPTLPGALKKAGYRTGVVGKWHLGLGGQEGVNWNQPIERSPNAVGFDFSHIMAATGDRVPCVYVEDGKVVNLDPADPIEVSYKTPFPGLPTGVSHRQDLKLDWSHGHNMAVINGIGRIGYMKGGTKALWKDEDMADHFSAQAVRFIRESKDKPFFLYFALHDPHVPRVPHPRFVGKTTMGPRGDVIVQADWQVGEVLKALDELRLAENTLVVLTSDNGPVIDDGYKDEAVKELGTHKPAGPFRGGKYSLYEGGTRVPTIARWPARVKPGKTSAAVISQIDFPKTFAAIAGAEASFPDSHDLSAALLGESEKGRDEVIEHAGQLAIRSGDWKFIPAGQGAKRSKATDTELGNEPTGQLFDLSKDPGEKTNVATAHPEKVAELKAKLEAVR